MDAKVATRAAFLGISGSSRVEVFVRVRPLSEAEVGEPGGSRVRAVEDGRSLTLRDARATEHYSFDGVIDEGATQESVFSRTMALQVEQACRGVPSCTFAYGQTGSGKTWTAFGDTSGRAGAEALGLVPRAAAALFTGLDERFGAGAGALAARLGVATEAQVPSVRLSIVAIHNEELSDLLFPGGAPAGFPVSDDPSDPVVLPFDAAIELIRQDTANEAAAAAQRATRAERRDRAGAGSGSAHATAVDDALDPAHRAASLGLIDHPVRGTLVLGLVQIEVTTAAQVTALVAAADVRSHVADTAMNRSSNRSHRIITFSIGVIKGSGTNTTLEHLSDLRVVDLAGSEDTNRSQARGTTKAEAGNINKSLLALGRVIGALSSGSPHIPYRESKLTRLLSEALGGVCVEEARAGVPVASSLIDPPHPPPRRRLQLQDDIYLLHLARSLVPNRDGVDAEIRAERVRGAEHRCPTQGSARRNAHDGNAQETRGARVVAVCAARVARERVGGRCCRARARAER